MSGGVTVHGGSDGIQAKIDDLMTASHLFASAADDVERTLLRCFWLSVRLSDSDVEGGFLSCLFARDALRDAVAVVGDVDDRLRGLSFVLAMAADGYRDTDDGVLARIGSVIATPVAAVAHLPGAVIDSGEALCDDGLFAAAQTFITEDPELIDTGLGVAVMTLPPGSVPFLKELADAYFDDGSPVVASRQNIRLEATAPPRGVADLMAALNSRDGGEPGEVGVRILTGPGGTRHVIVDIPGTKDWTPAHETPNVVGWATNVRAIDGNVTSYEQGVLDAMQKAGVRPTDDVMVVGHSLGGMVAVALARDAVRSGRFHVTHVVTAGSPIGTFVGHLPANVQVLALENKHDVVPHLDGADNPDLPNVTTATFDIDRGSIGDDHGIGTSYAPGAAAVDASDDAAIRAFLGGAGGYFSATTVETHSYVISRSTR